MARAKKDAEETPVEETPVVPEDETTVPDKPAEAPEPVDADAAEDLETVEAFEKTIQEKADEAEALGYIPSEVGDK